MESVPEDADIEQLLALRQQLLQELNNASDSTTPSRKEPSKNRYLEKSGCQRTAARKMEKRPNFSTLDKCKPEKRAKPADPERQEIGCKKPDDKDAGAWIPSFPVTSYRDAGGCPFQHSSRKFLNEMECGSTKLKSGFEFEHSTSSGAVKAEDVSSSTQSFLVNVKMEGFSALSFTGASVDEPAGDKMNSKLSGCTGRGALSDESCEEKIDAVAVEKMIPSPLAQPLPSTPKNEVIAENKIQLLAQQLSGETEEQGSVSRPGEGSGSSEKSESAETSTKDDKDIYLSDEDDGEDIDLLLEKPVEDAQTGKVIVPAEGEVRDKIVLAYRGTDYFDVLPEGWVEVTHSSGLPIYLHRSTRVCTFSRPYFIGPGSVRHHNVPVSAIPCLHQRRVLKEVEEGAAASAAALQNALSESNAARSGDGSGAEDNALVMARLQAPDTKVQTAEDFKERQLDPEALHDYAKSVFKFKTIQTYRFNKWSATRSFHRQRKLAEAGRLGKIASSIELSVGRPSLPSNVKLITVPALEANLKPQHRGFFLNPQGKTSVSVLHEYVQKVLKSTINYYFSETRNSSMPYGCTARLKMNLNNRVLCATSMKEKLMLLQEKQKREQRLQESGEQPDSDFVVLGVGCGNSKKAAKLDAARNALKVLIPDIEFDAEGIAVSEKKDKEDADSDKEDAIALFDMLPIEDSRISDLSARAGQPSPYLLLQECLKRNAAYGDTEIKLHSVRVKHQRHQFDMDVGKHRVSVICANKREGKQKASQAMLKKLHPNLDSWGSLIRLYGLEAQQKQQEARKNRQSIIKLQGGNRDKESTLFEPNTAILEKLRSEMLKLTKSKKQADEVVTPKRPKLSATNEPVDNAESVQKSADYAATHPDALSALRIDL